MRLLETLPAPPADAGPEILAERIAAADLARRGGTAPVSYDDDIADPLGQPLEAYRAIAWELETWNEQLVTAPVRRGRRRCRRGDVTMRIAVGADHAGFPLKEELKGFLETEGHQVIDVGTDSTDPVDYPAFCAAVARAVADGRAERGIVLGGSGQGEQIVANKIDGIRASLCHDLYTARLAREHNDANVLGMGARVIAPTYAKEIVRLWLATPFEGGRHEARIEQIAMIERGEL